MAADFRTWTELKEEERSLCIKPGALRDRYQNMKAWEATGCLAEKWNDTIFMLVIDIMNHATSGPRSRFRKSSNGVYVLLRMLSHSEKREDAVPFLVLVGKGSDYASHMLDAIKADKSIQQYGFYLALETGDTKVSGPQTALQAVSEVGSGDRLPVVSSRSLQTDRSIVCEAPTHERIEGDRAGDPILGSPVSVLGPHHERLIESISTSNFITQAPMGSNQSKIQTAGRYSQGYSSPHIISSDFELNTLGGRSSMGVRRVLEEQLLSILLPSIWGLGPLDLNEPDSLTRSEAWLYLDYYKNLLYDPTLIREDEISLVQIDSQCDKVVEIVRLVQQNRNRPISKIKDALLSFGKPPWLVRDNDQKAVSKIVDFAVRLWLFVPLHADKVTQRQGNDLRRAMRNFDRTTIKNEIQREVPPRLICRGNLSFGLTVENLIHKAGLVFRPTSSLSQHLSMEEISGRIEVYLFRHVKALERFQYEPHSDMYPDDFLHEVCQTMYLLFPVRDPMTIGRAGSLATQRTIDVETAFEAHVGLSRLGHLDLASYPYFGDRLRRLQERYDAATPGILTQLCFDRRKLVESANLWVGLAVFILTLIFGVGSLILTR